jgi:hypothetical protein
MQPPRSRRQADMISMKRTETRISDPLQIFSIHNDRDGGWCVEYFDQAGRSYVTVFVDPQTEPRARLFRCSQKWKAEDQTGGLALNQEREANREPATAHMMLRWTRPASGLCEKPQSVPAIEEAASKLIAVALRPRY